MTTKTPAVVPKRRKKKKKKVSARGTNSIKGEDQDDLPSLSLSEQSNVQTNSVLDTIIANENGKADSLIKEISRSARPQRDN